MSRREKHGDPPDPSIAMVEHVCRPPRWLVRAVWGLVALGALCIAGLVVGGVYVYQQQQYIEGKGEARDRETARLDERIDNAVNEGRCDLLDQLPEGGFLDRLRETFGCGPGIPIEDLPPEDAARIREQRAVPVPAPPPTQEQPPDTADRSRERPTLPGGPAERPVEPTPPPAPSPAPSEPPLIDLGPVGDLLCDNRLVCD